MGMAFRMLLIAGLCLAGFAGSADAANLLTNGSFEDGFTGWDHWNNSFVEGAGSGDPVGAQQGDAALKIFQAWWGANNWTGASQDVPVTVGSSYVFSGYLRNGNGDGLDVLDTGNSAFMKIDWLDADGNILFDSAHNVTGGIDPGSPAGEWLYNSFEVTVADVDPPVATARVVALHQYLGNAWEGGSSWFDNMAFEQVPEPGTVVMLLSGLVGLLFYGLRRRHG